jgi:hypothetical protein
MMYLMMAVIGTRRVWLLLVLLCVAATGLPPPREPPVHLRARYTMQGRIPWASWYFDSRGHEDAAPRVYDAATLAEFVDRARRRVPQADVYPKSDGWLFEALDAFPVAGKTVLVVGSQVPFYEALALACGAERVVVVEWQPITLSPPAQSAFGRKLQYVRPQELWVSGTNNMLTPREEWRSVFDAVISISSEEHNGLGRYGDPLGPEADLNHVDALRRLLLGGGGGGGGGGGRAGLLYIAVPTGPDCIVWNAHRVYGPVRWPALTRHWLEVGSFGYSEAKRGAMPACPHPDHHTFQPIRVLRAMPAVAEEL